jgi:hypothetical protein
MRIWDIPPRVLCRQHLLGEHRELHAIWAVMTQQKQGYARHTATTRWQGKLAALYKRHTHLVREMIRRGYAHYSPLDGRQGRGETRQRCYVDTPQQQRYILRQTGCACQV